MRILRSQWTGVENAPSIVGAVSPPAQAVMVVDPISPVVLAQGINTNSLGLDEERSTTGRLARHRTMAAGHDPFP